MKKWKELIQVDTFRTEQFWFSLLRSDSTRELWRPELLFALVGIRTVGHTGIAR